MLIKSIQKIKWNIPVKILNQINKKDMITLILKFYIENVILIEIKNLL